LDTFDLIVDALRDFSDNHSPIHFILIFDEWKLFLRGVSNTIVLVGISLVSGGLLALPIGVCRALRVPILNEIAYAYIYVVRGTPLLIQLYLIYYGVGQFEFVRDSFLWPFLREPWWCALTAFTISTSAYTAEAIRGGLEGVPKGEVEACIAVGMSRLQALRRVIVPSAYRRALPAYGNEVIFLIHASVVASTVTVIDIVGAARHFNNKFYLAYEGFIAAAILYLIIVYLFTLVYRRLENRWHRHLRPIEA